jgi:hypothetical protein
MPNIVEGRIAELCRDLAVEEKRMRQLQAEADELRTVIRQWVAQSEADRKRGSIVEDDGEQ